MLRIRDSSLERLARLTGSSVSDLKRYRRELMASDVPDVLLQRGANLAFAQELPQGALLYLAVRALSPQRVVETGVRPGYSTAWMLAALEWNGRGELYSIGPGSPEGRVRGVGAATVGQFVAPAWRARWTLVLGNTASRLEDVLGSSSGTDLFFYDNGPNPDRARHEFRAAWASLGPDGILLAHRADSGPAWGEFCRQQGLERQLVDPGPPALGGLALRAVDLGAVGG